ncbi:MAG: galactokinase [Tepidisphaeraceae bacterium]
MSSNPAQDLLSLDPVPALLSRVAGELSEQFDPSRPMRISRAPGRLDVMGGIADYTGSLVCEMPLDRAAAVVTQARDDREVQVFSFNLLDEHQPFTFRIPLDALLENSIEALRREFDQPGRKWAGYITGCLAILHEQKIVDLRDASLGGLNLALLSTVPLGAGISSSAAIEVATMMNVLQCLSPSPGTPGEGRGEGFVDGLRLASLCQQVENRVVGAPCGIMDQVTSCAGEAGTLLRMICQPHELQPPLKLPDGIRVIGINSNVKHSVGGGMYGVTRCAAFMGHRMILEKMREMGVAAGKTLERDPMNGYLANLDADDYKRFFRPYLPQSRRGDEFQQQFGSTIDAATKVAPDVDYHVLGATDHHVLEAQRVRNFATFLEEAGQAPPRTRQQGALLDKAGHLMYASHLSYTNDARLGADECDLLVKLAREHEPAGMYGAKITGGGSGGTVAILCDISEKTDRAIAKIMADYAAQTGRKPEAFTGTSPGAWQVGTVVR